MPTPEVWFAIPSASPEKCRKTLPVWRDMGYKIAVLQNYERADIPADITVWYDYYPGWPGSVNILCRKIVPASCPIVVTGGDDMLPDPNHSAELLAAQFLQRFPDTFGVMQPHGDEFMLARLYCGSPFLGRKWFTSMYGGSGAMFAGYRHNWADNELYWLAKGMGALWERRDLAHHHEHFTRSGEEKPAYWKQHVETRDLEDCRLYISRSWSRFPGHQPAPAAGITRAFDSSVLAQGALHLAEIRVAQSCYSDGVRVAWMQAMDSALSACAGRRLGPVAIYGAGTHTRAVGPVLMQPPVPIDCIIDDNPSRHGQRLWGWPIVSRDEALRRGIKAVVFSANTFESILWDNSECFLKAGLPVFRLYPPTHQERTDRLAAALARCAGARRIALLGAPADERGDAAWIAHFADRLDCIISDAPVPAPLPTVGARAALDRGIDAAIDCAPDRATRGGDSALMALTAAGIPITWMFSHAHAPNLAAAA